MRIRLRYTKLGKLRWTSHRDTARIWERTLRKAGVPVAYSAGFSPRPKISFGLALPTGAESLAEYLDFDLPEDLSPSDLASLPGRLGVELPEGMGVGAAVRVGAGEPSLQHDVVACCWEIDLDSELAGEPPASGGPPAGPLALA